ncbi:MAG: hypothetical protein QOE18_128 [Chloroflexota bacterium]|nr:hypothetical protein [Chloroflexota bacterium]
MPRPNPPRKRPRRRPDAVERAARAEVSLTKQTAQFKERNGAPEPKSPNAKPQPSAKATRGGPPPRARRIDQPFVPWSKRSYAIFVACIAGAELVVGAAAYFTLSNTPALPRPEFGLYLLGLSYNPLVVLAAALVAAPIAKLITRETRSLRFMESVMAGIIQYFVWLALFVVLTYAIGGFGSTSTAGSGSPSSTATPLATTPASPAATAAASPSPSASSTANSSTPAIVATPIAVAGLAIIDVISFVATFYIYPPLYRRMRIKPPPRGPRAPKEPDPKGSPAKGAKTNVDRMDDAAAQERKPKDPTP